MLDALKFWKREPRLTLRDAAAIILSSPNVSEDLRNRGFDWMDGIRELDQDFQKYLKQFTLFSDVCECVGARAETASSIPLRVERPDGEVVQNPPKHLAAFLDRPNPDQGLPEFIQSAIWQWDLQGECPYVGVLPSGQRSLVNETEYELSERTDEVWILRPAMLRPMYDDRFNRPGREDTNGVLIGWSFGDINAMRLPADAVALARQYHPRDAIRGLSPLKKMENKLRLQLATIRSAESYHANGAFPGLMITSELEPDAKTKQTWRDMFQKQHVGSMNWGKALFLWGSGIKLERLRDAPKDALQMDIMRIGQQAVRSQYRVPPFILADVEHANWSNSNEQQRFFWEFSIKPLMKALLGRLNMSPFVPDGYVIRPVYDDVAALQPDRREQADYVTTLVRERILTRNEARQVLGREPVEGGDEFKKEQVAPMLRATNGNGAPPTQEEQDALEEEVDMMAVRLGQGRLGLNGRARHLHGPLEIEL